jgi:hypothetical protein
MRKFKILRQGYYGRIGTLINEVDCGGCPRDRWHTLMIENYGKVLCTGDEIEEMLEEENVKPAREKNYPIVPEN